ncbi:helix-turn-helix domain-containing protein [Kallotenue papyrolyticum]|uniref:helix-turn-helix domain-containing protein n=1 Tax=Kallotenue papyrolyticum TaxID=1325125 RepID=UPI0004786366|nr:hypothetical protein [Kallotenue papyrolyticum]
MICPHCRGKKVNIVFVDYSDGTGELAKRICPTCQGAGVVTEQQAAQIDAGRALQADRRARGLTLAQEAARLGISPAELSAAELGHRTLDEVLSRKERFAVLDID